jgi:hypothetical protein
MLLDVDLDFIYGVGTGSGSGSSGSGSSGSASGSSTGYRPSRNHSKRSDIYSEITGTGYTAGGTTVTVSLVLDELKHQLQISVTNASWSSSTFTASGAVLYKSRGGAASSDELVAFFDFGAPRSVDSGTFTFQTDTPMVIQN